MRAKATYLLVVIALAACGAAYAAFSDGQRRDAAAVAAKASTSKVSASGHLGGLFPGARKSIHAELRNHSRRRWAVVRTVRADVQGGAPGCSPDNVSTVPKELSYPRIRPRKTRRIGVRIRMWQGAPDACQGVTFPLRYRLRLGGQ
jgi:hypothetical protein